MGTDTLKTLREFVMSTFDRRKKNSHDVPYSMICKYCINLFRANPLWTSQFPILGCFRGVEQAFRFMVGPGHCPMISKFGPSLSKAVGPVDSSFLVVKKSHNKNIHLTASLRTPQNRKYM